MYNPMTRRYALISGAGSGIGAKTAQMLSRNGYHLYLHYRRSEHNVRQIRDECEREGVEATVYQADFRKDEEIERMFQAFPRSPDIVINNAGCDHYELITDVSRQTWDDVMNVNVRSAFFCCQKALPHMMRRRFGRIINVSSIWGMTGASHEVLYSISKGALNAMTKAMAKEVAPHDITVNAVAPGLIDTDMMASFSEEEKKDFSADIPLQRLGRPEDVASLIVYLVSDAAGYMTGQIISPNGGTVI